MSAGHNLQSTCPTPHIPGRSTPPHAARSRASPRRWPPVRARAGTRASLRSPACCPARACSTSVAAPRLASTRARPRHHRRGRDRATGVPGPVRTRRPRRGPAVRGALVRSRLLLERDRARGARAPRGVCRRGATRRARLVRADSRPLVPDRAALAAARCPLAARRACAGATGGSAPPASGRTSRCSPRQSWRRCSARRCPSASGRWSRAGCACERPRAEGARPRGSACGRSAAEAADVVADPVDHEERQQQRCRPS